MRSIIPDTGKSARLDRRTLLGSLAGAGCALALPMLAAAQDDAEPPLPEAPESIERALADPSVRLGSHHRMTPTRTFRKRAGAAPWPVCADWPG